MSSRPRPKPRAAARPQPTSNPSGSGSASSSKVVDDDAVTALFTKKTTWKQLQERDERARKAEPVSSPGAEGSSDDEAPTPQTKGGKAHALPAWTRKPAKIDDAIIISDDESDVDVLSGSDDTPTRKRLRKEKALGKSKKPRSRSRSITPPPPVPRAAMERAAQLVADAFGGGKRARSRSPDADISFGSRVEDLDPELQKILNQVKSGAVVPSPSVGPARVNIVVNWVYHPEDTDAEPKSWTVQAGRHATFKRLFTTIAEELGLPKDEVFITYQKNQVFPGATPDSLKMWDKGEMEACHPTTREFIRNQRHTERALTPPPQADNSAPSRETTGSPGDNPPTKLVFRSSHTPDGITISVRDTATCEAVVNHYIRKVPALDKLKPAQKAKITLQFDGESIDRKTVLSELGAEEGDIFEVIGF